MSPKQSSPGLDEMRVPLPPFVSGDEPGVDLARLGEALKARLGDVLEQTVARTSASGEVVDAVVQESFEKICNSSTDRGGPLDRGGGYGGGD